MVVRLSLAVLGVATVATALVAEILVGSLEVFAEQAGLSDFFVAAVIVAIVGNAAEHGGAVVVAYRGKITLAAEIALSSAAQVALFLIPAVALLSWLPRSSRWRCPSARWKSSRSAGRSSPPLSCSGAGARRGCAATRFSRSTPASSSRSTRPATAGPRRASPVDRLCEYHSALRIRAAVPSMAEGKIVELFDDRRAGALGAFEMCVDVVDQHVDERGPAHRCGVPIAARRLSEIDASAAGTTSSSACKPPAPPIARSTSPNPNARVENSIAASPSSYSRYGCTVCAIASRLRAREAAGRAPP